MKRRLLPITFLVLSGILAIAEPLREATLTRVINQVRILSGPQRETVRSAQANELFRTPDALQTGPTSLAELTAADNTVTRIGANTIFSYESQGRVINLDQGSILFHSPKGKGGGSIRTKAASASVLGTTIIVLCTTNGGFKTVVLEGKAKVRLESGAQRTLEAGQLLYVLPNSQNFGPTVFIDLDRMVKVSKLVNGFGSPIASESRIQDAVQKQQSQIAKGGFEQTDLIAGDAATEKGMQVIDPGMQKAAITGTGEQAGLEGSQLGLAHSSLGMNVDVKGPLNQSEYAAHLVSDPLDFALVSGGYVSAWRGFFAHDMTFSVSSLDLSSYRASSPNNYFDFVAGGDMNIKGNLNFSDNTAESPSEEMMLSLNVAGSLNITPGSVISTYHLGSLYIRSGSDLNLNSVGFVLQPISSYGATLQIEAPNINYVNSEPGYSEYNDLLNVNFVSPGNISINVPGINVASLNVSASHDITVNNSSLNMSTTMGASGNLTLHSGGELNISSSSIYNPSSVSIRADGNVGTLGNVTVTDSHFVMNSGGQFTVSSGNLLSWVNSPIENATSIHMSAITILLANIDFPADKPVYLNSLYGTLGDRPNQARPPQYGCVNFFYNVTYGGENAANRIGSGITIGRLTTP